MKKKSSKSLKDIAIARLAWYNTSISRYLKKTRTSSVSRCGRPSHLILYIVILIAVSNVYSLLNYIDYNAHPGQSEPLLRNKFLPSTSGLYPTGSGKANSVNRLHIAFIFDENRLNYSISAIRSIMHYSEHPITFHFITPSSLHLLLNQLPLKLPGDVYIVTYDIGICDPLSSLVSYIAPEVHKSIHCKPFLAEIIPSDYVLFVDNDITAISDISYCWDVRSLLPDHSSTFGEEALLAMSVDMGDVCQLKPDECFPIGMKFWIPPGLKCGTTPRKAKKIIDNGALCRSSGDYEPYQFNGGVILMNLKTMRRTHFTARFVQASIYTWRALNYPQIRWGQDLLNNFFRLFPKTIANLPCGCNYQFSGTRRESKCPNQPIAIGHVWNSGVDAKKKSPLLNHFLYFFNSSLIYSNRDTIQPPRVRPRSLKPPDWNPPAANLFGGKTLDVAFKVHDPTCSLQSYRCKLSDAKTSQRMAITSLNENVNIIALFNNDTSAVKSLLQSVEEQTHSSVSHIMGVQDSDWIRNELDINSVALQTVYFNKHHRDAKDFDPCQQCFRSKKSCYSDMFLKERSISWPTLKCVCNSFQPYGSQYNELQKKVIHGWILYLSDGQMLSSKFSISEFLASVHPLRKVVVFRSFVGRHKLPSLEMFEERRIAPGEFETSNLAVHSTILDSVSWSKQGCAGYHTVRYLATKFPIQWINLTFTETDPSTVLKIESKIREDKLGGKVTVLITSYLALGWRPFWVRRIVREYTAPEMHDIISKVILVWNNPVQDVPSVLLEMENERFQIIRMQRNSLNNRWIEALPHINTDGVLNFDDDIYVKREAVLCILNWFHRNHSRIISPFVRQIGVGEYSVDDLNDSRAYSMVLPRVLMLQKRLLHLYAQKSNMRFHEYVDVQEAHCDDVLLNIIAQRSGMTPLRIVLPPNSVVDWFRPCLHKDKTLTGGISLHPNRTVQRTQCVHDLLAYFKNLTFAQQIATCTNRGNADLIVEKVEEKRFRYMIDSSTSSKCELDTSG